MKIKPIILTGDKTTEFIRVIAAQHKVYSATELKLIKVMVEADMFTPAHIDKYSREKLGRAASISYGTLSTCLARLTKAGVIARSNKNLYLNPVFKGLDQVDAVVYRF